MRIIVCLKQVPAHDTPLRVEPGANWISESDAPFEINEADLHAVEAALQLRDRHNGEVIVLSLGPERVTRSLRDALAKGADRAIHIMDSTPGLHDPLTVATLLAAVATDEHPDLILTGLQSDDAGFGQTGAMIAAVMDLPHISIATGIKVEAGGLRVTRELGGGWLQDVDIALPALLTIQAGINKPRYAGMKGIMAAKRKEIRTLPAATITDDLPLAGQEPVQLYQPPEAVETEYLEGSPAEMAEQLYSRISPLLPAN